ncbi:hypothetical protein [Streptomyces sp. WM6386]|uniref:hypothetical protein n=1 Tax=Streptomyces sp. WM6386 TaxID=1415558 RepID=UPI00131C0855|nr:hypothetical protein [Streptomyces sp. WM6386]
MDRFEQELTRMMRAGHTDRPYEDRHRYRLHAGVRARQRARAAWMATASVLTIAGLGIGLLLLASSVTQGGPHTRQPRPVTSAESVPVPSTVLPASTAQVGAGSSGPAR